MKDLSDGFLFLLLIYKSVSVFFYYFIFIGCIRSTNILFCWFNFVSLYILMWISVKILNILPVFLILSRRFVYCLIRQVMTVEIFVFVTAGLWTRYPLVVRHVADVWDEVSTHKVWPALLCIWSPAAVRAVPHGHGRIYLVLPHAANCLIYP
jgi:hypothetical protein